MEVFLYVRMRICLFMSTTVFVYVSLNIFVYISRSKYYCTYLSVWVCVFEDACVPVYLFFYPSTNRPLNVSAIVCQSALLEYPLSSEHIKQLSLAYGKSKVPS